MFDFCPVFPLPQSDSIFAKDGVELLISALDAMIDKFSEREHRRAGSEVGGLCSWPRRPGEGMRS